MAQLLCSRASVPGDVPWWTLAVMVEAAAGTVGGRSGPTGGRVDGSETRNLGYEGYAREEIESSVDCACADNAYRHFHTNTLWQLGAAGPAAALLLVLRARLCVRFCIPY